MSAFVIVAKSFGGALALHDARVRDSRSFFAAIQIVSRECSWLSLDRVRSRTAKRNCARSSSTLGVAKRERLRERKASSANECKDNSLELSHGALALMQNRLVRLNLSDIANAAYVKYTKIAER